MIRDKKILAVIPARGGSKRLPRKNIKKFRGKALITWTIETALKSKYLDRVIVSTEDKKIAQLSKRYGAEVIKRPKSLSTDRARVEDAVFHTLSVLKKQNYEPDVVVLLQPTSPLRTRKDIDEAIAKFLKNECNSLISVCEASPSPYWSFRIQDGYLEPFAGWKYLKMRSQDIPRTYMANGAIYISTPKNLFKNKSFYCKKILPYIMPKERSIDIDDEIDFKLAELLLRR